MAAPLVHIDLKNSLPDISRKSQAAQAKVGDFRGMSSSEYTQFLMKQRRLLDASANSRAPSSQVGPAERKVRHATQGPEESKAPGQLSEYAIGKEIGKGAYAVVKHAVHKPTQRRVAVKIYEKFKLLDPQKKKNVMREIQILKKLDHPNIVKLFERINAPRQLHLVLEYINGQSLQTYLRQKRILPESEARLIFQQILDAVAYCHSQDVSHRDLKLDNILLDVNLTPKLIDFGFSTCVPNGQKSKVFCGTPSYMAPEIIKKQDYSGLPADVWALGVLLYVMVSGTFPFKGKNNTELYRKIQHGAYSTPPGVSEDCRTVLSRVLRVDPDKRLTIPQLLEEKWFLTEQVAS